MAESRERVLKAGGRRSVRLVDAADGSREVVKRFSSGGLAGATLDRARAAREHRMLSALHGSGVLVPRPLALERSGDAWEVRMEWIEGSVTLADVLAKRASWPAGPERAARGLGELLARLHAAGVDHPDLHPGNALLGADGRCWAIDFHKARRVHRLGRRRVLRDLVSLTASVRETTRPEFRARAFLAWIRALPDSLKPPGSPAELAREIETAARHHRVAVVRKRRARWTRHGTACVAVDERFRGFVRRGVAPEAAGELDRAARERPPGLGCAASESGELLVTGLSERDCKRAWLAAARLEEHGLACSAPIAISFEPRPWIALRLAPESSPCLAPAELRSRRGLRALGELCAALADRGLKPTGAAGALFWRSPNGAVSIGPVLDLAHERRAAGGVDTVRALALAGLSVAELTHSERAAFAVGLLRGVALTPAARRRLRADLRHG